VKKFFVVMVLALLPSLALAADSLAERPRWSLEVKGGLFVPGIENWSTYFGNRDTGEFGGSLAYKITKQLELGVEALTFRDHGQGVQPAHNNAIAGSVKYEAAPLNVFALARGVFSENQWLIPYAGGGWTRMFYREEVEGQGIVRGARNGYHARAGLQLLLDVLDPKAATGMYLDYGIQHTYFFIEAEYTHATVDTVTSAAFASQTVNIGGKSWFGGLLFEF
jgi:hypothetical protein